MLKKLFPDARWKLSSPLHENTIHGKFNKTQDSPIALLVSLRIGNFPWSWKLVVYGPLSRNICILFVVVHCWNKGAIQYYITLHFIAWHYITSGDCYCGLIYLCADDPRPPGVCHHHQHQHHPHHQHYQHQQYFGHWSHSFKRFMILILDGVNISPWLSLEAAGYRHDQTISITIIIMIITIQRRRRRWSTCRRTTRSCSPTSCPSTSPSISCPATRIMM